MLEILKQIEPWHVLTAVVVGTAAVLAVLVVYLGHIIDLVKCANGTLCSVNITQASREVRGAEMGVVLLQTIHGLQSVVLDKWSALAEEQIREQFRLGVHSVQIDASIAYLRDAASYYGADGRTAHKEKLTEIAELLERIRPPAWQPTEEQPAVTE